VLYFKYSVYSRGKLCGLNDVVITLIFTRHAYLALGHIRFLFFQSTVEQIFLKTLFIKAHMPYSITTRVYTLADPKQPACTYKSTKKESLLTEHTTLGELTKPSGHAWTRVCPNTSLLLAYKRRVWGPIWRRRIIVKKLYPIVHSLCPNPLSFLVQRER
jgi:hypothetical protein